MSNIILNTDSYKLSMFEQYPEGTKNVYSYIEARKGGNIVFFGLQAYIKEYLSRPITMADIDEAEAVLALHGAPFNRAGWEHILNKHRGYMPVVIKALPEGSIVPSGTVLVTVHNTDPEVPWITTHLETSMLRAVWYASTVATNSWKIRQTIKKYLEISGDVSSLDFKLHDFGARGVSSFESAGIGGAAHLLNFNGTDTISGILHARKYYDAGVCGFSIPAAEHSTITSWGVDNESNAYENMINKFSKPGSIYAVVSDSYDFYNAVDNIWGNELRQKVIDSGGTLVIRPDSGDPRDMVIYALRSLEKTFGSTVNEKGYRVLNNVRVIQGDGINSEMINQILLLTIAEGFSADNVAFGMGGALLQAVTRDDYSFAMKCSAIHFGDGIWHPVIKNPVTDSGKKSKGGVMSVILSDTGVYANVPGSWSTDQLRENYVNDTEVGYIQNIDSVQNIRERVRG
jgi:nicotinamide phosphoribosyltransferase